MALLSGFAGLGSKLSSRASSQTLSRGASRHLDTTDGTVDEVKMSITRELLKQGADLVRIPPRRSSFGQGMASRPSIPSMGSMPNIRMNGPSARQESRSNTWSSSEGVLEVDEKEDRELFVQEYNKIAKKYGVPILVPEGFEIVTIDKITIEGRSGSWLMRKILKRTSSIPLTKTKTEKVSLKHKRSLSDMTARLQNKKSALKDKDLDELVRLCGISALTLPADYSPQSLSVPTCFRATAQYLVHHAPMTRGAFRIPGSKVAVNALYDHFAAQNDQDDFVAGTIRPPILPNHIKCDVHDVASAFKHFLAGLPRGMLGSTWLFDAFVNIYGILDADSPTVPTKQPKIRARLIALAIASVPSRHERELICAVMGLLSMVGGATEKARGDDVCTDHHNTSDLMGFESLAVIFGPLLLGESLDGHALNIPPHLDKNGVFHTATISPPKSWRGKQKKKRYSDNDSSLRLHTEKIKMANNVAEMLITHWQDVVRQMRNFGGLKSAREFKAGLDLKHVLRSSASEMFGLNKPPPWEQRKTSFTGISETVSPTPEPRPMSGPLQDIALGPPRDSLFVRKHRSCARSTSNPMLHGSKSFSVLSPTVEECTPEARTKGVTSSLEHNLSYMASHSLHQPDRVIPSTEVLVLADTMSNRAAPRHNVRKLSPQHVPAPEERYLRDRGSPQPGRQALWISPDNHDSKGRNETGRQPPMDWNTVVGPASEKFRSQQTHHEDHGAEMSSFPAGFLANHSGAQGQHATKVSSTQASSASSIANHVRRFQLREPGQHKDAGNPAKCGSRNSNTVSIANSGNDLLTRRHQLGRGSASTNPSILNPLRDPLARLSQEDDLASLRSLAAALGSEDAVAETTTQQSHDRDKRINTRRTKSNSVTKEPHETSTTQDDSLDAIENPERSSRSSTSPNKAHATSDHRIEQQKFSVDATSSHDSNQRKTDAYSHLVLPCSSLSKHATEKNQSDRICVTPELPTSFATPKRLGINLETKTTPIRAKIVNSLVYTTPKAPNTAGSHVKALAAKFNDADAANRGPGSAMAALLAFSPWTSPVKQSVLIDSPSSVAACYTINPSPARSHRSSRSEQAISTSQRELQGLPGRPAQPISRVGSGSRRGTPTAFRKYRETGITDRGSPVAQARSKDFDAHRLSSEDIIARSPVGLHSLHVDDAENMDTKHLAGPSESRDPAVNNVDGSADNKYGTCCGRGLGADARVGVHLGSEDPLVAKHFVVTKPKLAASQFDADRQSVLSDPSTKDCDHSMQLKHQKQPSMSMLFKQMTALQTSLRRQSETIDDVGDLDTLKEELRQTKRDMIKWKRRAEVAEARLTMLRGTDNQEDHLRSSTLYSNSTMGSMAGHFDEEEEYESDRMVSRIKISQGETTSTFIRVGMIPLSGERFSGRGEAFNNRDLTYIDLKDKAHTTNGQDVAKGSHTRAKSDDSMVEDTYSRAQEASHIGRRRHSYDMAEDRTTVPVNSMAITTRSHDNYHDHRLETKSDQDSKPGELEDSDKENVRPPPKWNKL